MRSLRTLLILSAAASLSAQQPPPPDPAQVLFDAGSRSEAAGRLDRAKLIFLTLADTYNGDPNAAKAKIELGAIFLFMEAQSQVEAGKNESAYSTFRTLIRTYPESLLAKLADTRAKSLGVPPDPRR